MSFVDSWKDPRNRSTVIAVAAAVGIGIFAASYFYSKTHHHGQTKGGSCPFTGAKGQKKTKTGRVLAHPDGGKRLVASPRNRGRDQGATGFAGVSSGVSQPQQAAKSVALPQATARILQFKERNLVRYFNVKKRAIHDDRHQVFEYETLVQIQNLVLELTCHDAAQIVKVTRERRRLLFNKDRAEYARVTEEGIEEVEDLFRENLDEILREFGVSRDTYEKSVQVHVQEDPTVYLDGPDLYEVIIGNLPAHNEPRENTQEYFTKVYQDMSKKLRGVDISIPQSVRAAEVKNAYMLDTIYFETGLEEEDIKFLRKKYESPELRKIDEEIATRLETAEAKANAVQNTQVNQTIQNAAIGEGR